LIYEDRQLTYDVLNTRANQLARYLRQLGVGPETPVGICLERSVEIVIALLGVLKAGGAYVPLDPSLPEDRLANMLDDSQARLLLTRRNLLTRFPSQTPRLIFLDDRLDVLFAFEEEDFVGPSPSDESETAAYIIYTSGSTGKPKGVVVS